MGGKAASGRDQSSGIELVAADMPVANKLTIHIPAAAAEHEGEAISERIGGGESAPNAVRQPEPRKCSEVNEGLQESAGQTLYGQYPVDHAARIPSSL
jgi:CTP:molybdopterin cytidylyltransferase MocA